MNLFISQSSSCAHMYVINDPVCSDNSFLVKVAPDQHFSPCSHVLISWKPVVVQSSAAALQKRKDHHYSQDIWKSSQTWTITFFFPIIKNNEPKADSDLDSPLIQVDVWWQSWIRGESTRVSLLLLYFCADEILQTKSTGLWEIHPGQCPEKNKWRYLFIQIWHHV